MLRCTARANAIRSAFQGYAPRGSSFCQHAPFSALTVDKSTSWGRHADFATGRNLQRTAPFCSNAEGPPKELEILPLPKGISGDKVQMFELLGTEGTGKDEDGYTSVLTVHGPPEGWQREGEPLYGANGGCFAVIEAGGKQLKVVADNSFYINRIPGEVNESVVFDKVLMVGTVAWSVFGRPYIPTATVLGTIEEQTLSGKVMVAKFKKRKGYRRRQGHRQNVSLIRVNEVKFDLPDASGLSPFEIELDPMRPPASNSPTFM